MNKYNKNNNGPSAEDRAMDLFAEMMIEKIESVSQDWKKPWFTKGSLQWPQNLNGHQYNGMNAVILMLHQEKKGWKSNRYATFEGYNSLNYDKNRKPLLDKEGNKLPYLSVNKGEKSIPVLFTSFTVIHKDTKEKIKYEDYKRMSEEERVNYNVYPKRMVYNVFNIDQTNMKETRPEMYAKFINDFNEQQEHIEAEAQKELPAVDLMIKEDLYVCPIIPVYQDRAFYRNTEDIIYVPEKGQFKNNEAFYGTVFHEMSHASGASNRLNRLKPMQSMLDPEYAREELVAELTAALLCSKYGMEKNLKSDSATYLKSWLSNLQQDPSYIKTTLFDVKNSSNYISSRIDIIDNRLKRDGVNADFSDIKIQNKNNNTLYVTPKQEEQPQQQEQQQQQEEVTEQQTEQVRFHRR